MARFDLAGDEILDWTHLGRADVVAHSHAREAPGFSGIWSQKVVARVALPVVRRSTHGAFLFPICRKSRSVMLETLEARRGDA